MRGSCSEEARNAFKAQIALLEDAMTNAVNRAELALAPPVNDAVGITPATDLIRAVAHELLSTIQPPAPALPPPIKPAVEAAVEDADDAWSVASFMRSIGLDEVIAAALQPPTRGQFGYMRSLERGTLLELLARARLEGLCDVIWAGVLRLRQQEEATGAELSAKFAMSSHTLALGELRSFFGGLEALIGPPLMVDGSLEKSMRLEHNDPRDRDVEFESSNGARPASLCLASSPLPLPHQASPALSIL